MKTVGIDTDFITVLGLHTREGEVLEPLRSLDYEIIWSGTGMSALDLAHILVSLVSLFARIEFVHPFDP